MTDTPGGLAPPPGGFHPPRKRSITIAAHPTSISLEPIFWAALEDAARVRGLPLSALVAQIDHLRIQGDDPSDPAPNLASAIRTWLLHQARALRQSYDNIENDSQSC